MAEEIKQGDCEVCMGKEVVENGVCRNCGATTGSDLKDSGSDSEAGALTGEGGLEPEAKTE